MARNMIRANRHIFSKLVEFVEESDVSVEQPDAIRYIKTDDEGKKWLKELKALDRDRYPYPILPMLKVSSIEFDEKEYFVIVGWETSISFIEILNQVPLNAGLATALLSDLDIPVRQGSDPFSIVDEVLFQYGRDKTDPSYSGHDFNDIVKFFEPFYVYEIRDDSPLRGDDLFRIAGYAVCQYSDHIFLSFSPETIRKFKKMFLEGVSNIPYENLLLSLTAIHWKFSFLDIYRCLECLFPIVSLDELYQNIGCSISLLELSIEIEERIKWWPKEAEAINKLIDGASPDARELLWEVKNSLVGDTEGKKFDFFYEIRNSIVHYRPGTRTYTLNQENWDKLIKGGLAVIEYWYKRYDSSLKPGGSAGMEMRCDVKKRIVP